MLEENHTMYAQQGHHETIAQELKNMLSLEQLRNVVPTEEARTIDAYQIKLLARPLDLIFEPLPPELKQEHPEAVPILLNNISTYDDQIKAAIKADRVMKMLRIAQDDRHNKDRVMMARRCRRSIVALLFDEAGVKTS